MSTEAPTQAMEKQPASKWWDVRARLRAKWQELKSESASPEKLGVAFGVGVFWGCSPFHGFQWLACLATAWLFRLNKIAALVGLQISAPPVTPLVAFAGLQLGALIVHRKFLPLSVSEIRAMSNDHLARTLLTDFVVGGVAFGVLMGVILGFAATWVLRRQRAMKAARS